MVQAKERIVSLQNRPPNPLPTTSPREFRFSLHRVSFSFSCGDSLGTGKPHKRARRALRQGGRGKEKGWGRAGVPHLVRARRRRRRARRRPGNAAWESRRDLAAPPRHPVAHTRPLSVGVLSLSSWSPAALLCSSGLVSSPPPATPPLPFAFAAVVGSWLSACFACSASSLSHPRIWLGPAGRGEEEEVVFVGGCAATAR
jgi:hypothetical protein